MVLSVGGVVVVLFAGVLSRDDHIVGRICVPTSPGCVLDASGELGACSREQMGG